MTLYSIPESWEAVPDEVEQLAAEVRATLGRYYRFAPHRRYDNAGIFLLEQALSRYRDANTTPSAKVQAAQAVELLALFVGVEGHGATT